MHKHRKIFAILLVAGVLLGGLGTGIAVAEYTALSYAGQRVIGLEEVTRDRITVDIPDYCTRENPLALNVHAGAAETRVEADSSVPQGTLTMDVAYNPTQVELMWSVEDFWDEDEAAHDREDGMPNAFLYLRYSRFRDTYVADFFAMKDMVLADLKAGQLGDYTTAYVESIRVGVNPQDMERLGAF